MDTSLPNRLEPVFFAGLVIMFAAWLLLSAAAVISRLLHNRRQRRPRAARTADVPTLVRVASARDERNKWKRIGALFALADRHAPEAYGVLDAAVRDADPDVASAGAAALRRVGDHRAGAILVSALRTATLTTSRIAMQVDQFPLPIADLIAPLLDDTQTRTRYWAASLLMRYPDVDGLADRVAKLTEDADPQVRKAALATVGAMSASVAIPAARRHLVDPVTYVRSTAARVLAKRGALDAEHGAGAVAEWVKPLLTDSSWEVRTAAQDALERLGAAPTEREVALERSVEVGAAPMSDVRLIPMPEAIGAKAPAEESKLPQERPR